MAVATTVARAGAARAGATRAGGFLTASVGLPPLAGQPDALATSLAADGRADALATASAASSLAAAGAASSVSDLGSVVTPGVASRVDGPSAS